jgi:exonuclease V gamma subunit
MASDTSSDLHLIAEADLDTLGLQLALALKATRSDPFRTVVIAVPTREMQTWIARRIAEVAGVCMNVEADRSSFVMSSADLLARPRVRGPFTLAVPEHPQTCALEHARSGRRRRRLVERLIAQHPDEHAEQAIGDAAHRTRVVGDVGS